MYGDGRVYPDQSLPAVVAGLPTTYHYDPLPFFAMMKDYKRDRILDPSQCRPNTPAAALPQDSTNYIREPSWRILTPGMRVSTGLASTTGTHASVSRSTTSGVLLRKGTTQYMTAASHGFLHETEVFHPTENGDKVGDIVNRYSELDIAMVKLTLAYSVWFTNDTYFQAEPPTRLAEEHELSYGTWFVKLTA